MNLRWTLAPLAYAALLPAETTIAFAPSEGASISKSFEVEMTFALEDATASMNGEEMPMGPGGDVEGEMSYTLEVVDVFESMADGRPAVLLRSYDEVATTYDVMGDSGGESMDDISGKSVRFTWNAEENTYDRAWAGDDEGDDEDSVLQTLAADLDLGALLPDGPVAEGATWEVSLAELGSIFVPGLDFDRARESDMEGMDNMPVEILEPMQEALAEATVACRFAGMRDGRPVIAFDVSADFGFDASDAIMQSIAESGQTDFEPDVAEFAVDISFECAGELLWNLELGVFETFELNGEALIDVYADAEVDFGGMGAMPIEAEAELSLEMSIEASAEPTD